MTLRRVVHCCAWGGGASLLIVASVLYAGLTNFDPGVESAPTHRVARAALVVPAAAPVLAVVAQPNVVAAQEDTNPLRLVSSSRLLLHRTQT